MSDLQITQTNLPAEPMELAKFVLVGVEKAKAIKAEIRAIQKLKLADEVWHQKQKELQMVREAVIEAETRIGVLFNNMPKQSGGDRRSEDFKSADNSGFENENKSPEAGLLKTRKELAEAMGFSKQDVNRYQQMAKHPEAVEQAKAEAREKGTDLTTQSVLDKIREQRTREPENNTVDLKQFREAKADEAYYRSIEDEREYDKLNKALNTMDKVAHDADGWKAIARWCAASNTDDVDIRELEGERILDAIKKLQGILMAFGKAEE